MLSILITALLILLPCFEGSVIDSGKVLLNNALPNDPGCIDVVFNSLFEHDQDIRLITSLSHSDRHRSVHDPAALWVKRISSRGFKVCVRESGIGSNGTGIVNWFAVQGSYVGHEQGVVSFDRWGSGTQCKTVRPQRSYSRPLHVFATVIAPNSSTRQDAMNVWVSKDARGGAFSVCLREMTNFDGIHSQIKANWIAYQEMPYSLNLTDSSTISIDTNSGLVQQIGYSFCKTVRFENENFLPPVVVITGSYYGNDSRPLAQECKAMNVWIEETTKTYFRVCARELNDGRATGFVMNIDYIVQGDLDPCINVSCNYFAVCKAFGPRDARCVCVEDCPSYEEQVCSSNGTTFRNKCYFELEMCRLKSNHTMYHPGSCTGFPLEKGRTSLSSSPVDGTLCKQVRFRSFAFYPDKQVHVHLTVNHFNTTNPDYVHDASASWVENVNYKGFTACVTIAGRNERARVAHTTFDWFAYQGAPDGGVTERTRIDEWWTGTKCKTIELPEGKFQSAPTVIVTAEHISDAFKHDAANLWLENVNQSSLQICLRELQNFDGLHENIHVSWIAFEEIHRPLFSEKGKTFFPNTGQPSMEYNGAFCKDLKFSKIYDHVPAVILSTNHTTSSEMSRPEYNGVATWIEYMNKTGFRVCVKELYTTKYEPLTVNFLVLSEICQPQWNYFDGICYHTISSCDTWNGSENRCRSSQAHLANIQSQRQNVYIQQRLNGAKGWIGLNDKSVEGVFRWTSGMQNNWTYWAVNQPNNAGDQDCVHTLGIGHQYHWDDVSCNECHNFTCEKDLNECRKEASSCHDDALCINTYGSHSCQCKTGYFGNGQQCTDVDECVISSPCGLNATCTNVPGSFVCQCKKGLSGDGFNCSDIDECATQRHDCHVNATCSNTEGSYKCTCNSSYYGNGKVCTLHSSRTYFNVTGSGRYGTVQTFSVRKTGNYLIRAGGARGGTHSYNYGYNPGTYYGGRGATMEGRFQLHSGTTLNIVVGQRGGNSVEIKGGGSTTRTAAQLGVSVEDNAGTGGGGGSFVYTSSNTLLLAAGGGGGASAGYNGIDGQGGTAGTSSRGTDSSKVRSGGSGGNPGQCNSAGGDYHGGVGAGWNGWGCSRLGPEHGDRGGSRGQGWVGGRAGRMNSGYNGGPAPGAVGGFGGGGGGSEDNGASGGGGGYSGGGSGTYHEQAGGGGGSYCSGINCRGVTGGNPNDNGFIEITLL